MALSVIAEQIRANLKAEEIGANEYKWQRGLLYTQARNNPKFNNNIAFGKWCKEEFRSAPGGRTDASGVISKLQKCVKLLTKEQFCTLGYSRATELMVQSTWDNYPTQVAELVQDVIDLRMTKAQVNAAMKAIKELEPIPLHNLSLSTIEVLEARLEIKDNTYQEGTTFFSGHPTLLAEQLNQVNTSERYACLLLGVDRSHIGQMDITAVKKRKRTLANKYHPDKRNGDTSIMEAINKASEIVSLLHQLTSNSN